MEISGEHSREYRSSALSNATGTVVGGVFAAVATHFAMPDLQWLPLVSTVVGSGAGGWAGAYLNDHLRPHFPVSWHLSRLLRRKLKSDFEHSYLESSTELNQASNESKDLLREAKLLSSGGAHYFASDVPRIIPSERLGRAGRAVFERDLYQHEPISVNCAALFPAALAALFSLKERMKSQVILNVDYSDVNSHDQFERLTLGHRFDFVIAAEAPFFLITLGDANDSIEPRELAKYVRLFPCNIEWQYAFMKKGNRNPSAVHIYQTSSAKLQYNLGLGRGIGTLEEQKVLKGREMPYFADKDRLGAGECVVAWEPLAELFHSNPFFEPLRIDPFPVWISMFCNSDWMSASRSSQTEAFRQLFIDEWRHLNDAKGRYATAYNILVAKPNLLERFAMSSGLVRDPKYDRSRIMAGLRD